MDLIKEKMKMKNILNDMTIAEFDEMLEKCGMDVIKPSCMSNYALCLDDILGNDSTGYIIKEKKFILDSYDKYNYFELEGQGAA